MSRRDPVVRRLQHLAARGGHTARAFARIADLEAADLPAPQLTAQPPTSEIPPPAMPPPLVLVPPAVPNAAAVYVVVYSAGSWHLHEAAVGKQNSGGAGFRALVIPNEPR